MDHVIKTFYSCNVFATFVQEIFPIKFQVNSARNINEVHTILYVIIYYVVIHLDIEYIKLYKQYFVASPKLVLFIYDNV